MKLFSFFKTILKLNKINFTIDKKFYKSDKKKVEKNKLISLNIYDLLNKLLFYLCNK